MRKALPVMTEEVAPLKPRLQRERDGRKTPPLQMLDVLASGQARTGRAVAQWLGVHRHTSGHWLAIDATGGLEAWLKVHVPAGQPLSRSPAVLAASAQALQEPAGFASYAALRPWVQQTPHVAVNDHTLYPIVRTRFRAKLKVPRPRHTKTPGRHRGVPGDLSGAAARCCSTPEYPPDTGV